MHPVRLTSPSFPLSFPRFLPPSFSPLFLLSFLLISPSPSCPLAPLPPMLICHPFHPNPINQSQHQQPAGMKPITTCHTKLLEHMQLTCCWRFCWSCKLQFQWTHWGPEDWTGATQSPDTRGGKGVRLQKGSEWNRGELRRRGTPYLKGGCGGRGEREGGKVGRGKGEGGREWGYRKVQNGTGEGVEKTRNSILEGRVCGWGGKGGGGRGEGACPSSSSSLRVG